MIVHHPHDELLVEYANGSLGAAETLLVACHASMCAECHGLISDYETVGAALLDEAEEAEISAESLGAVMARIESLREVPLEPAYSMLDLETRRIVPPPLRPVLGSSLSSLAWRKLGRHLRRVALPGLGGKRISLIEIAADGKVPAHTHTGNEYTLVLAGIFRVGRTDYGVGDLAFADVSVTHRPQATAAGPCLCLTVEDGPVKLTGPVGRLLNPFIRT